MKCAYNQRQGETALNGQRTDFKSIYMNGNWETGKLINIIIVCRVRRAFSYSLYLDTNKLAQDWVNLYSFLEHL